MSNNPTRRKFYQAAGAAFARIPVAGISRLAYAATNPTLRAALKYQDNPKGDMTCAVCLEFLPSKVENGPGGCKLLPGDNEISPNGYCIRWNTM